MKEFGGGVNGTVLYHDYGDGDTPPMHLSKLIELYSTVNFILYKLTG